MTSAKPFTPDLFAEGEEVGLTRSEFGNALSAWAWMQRRDVTVAEAAAAFNTTSEAVVTAVEDHGWMFIAGAEGAGPALQFIEQVSHKAKARIQSARACVDGLLEKAHQAGLTQSDMRAVLSALLLSVVEQGASDASPDKKGEVA